MNLLSRSFFVVLFLFAQVLGAKTQATQIIGLSVCTLGYAEDHKSVYLLDGDDQAVEIALSTARIVGPYRIALDADSTAILRGKKETEEGTVTYYPVAQAKLPGHTKEPVMILVPSTESLPYRAIIIDRSLEHLSVGSYLMINLSPMEVRGSVGDNEVVVSANNDTTIILSSEDADSLDVHFEFEGADGWQTFARTRWTQAVSKRSLLLVYQDPKTERMRIRGVPIR